MTHLLDIFWNLSPAQAALGLLIENILLFLLSIAGGHVLLFLFANRRVVEIPEPLEWQELAWAGSCVLLNTVVTIAGWFLWKHGIIRISRDISWRIALDVLVLFITMDFAMYLSHRIAHLRWVYPWVHHTHQHV